MVKPGASRLRAAARSRRSMASRYWRTTASGFKELLQRLVRRLDEVRAAADLPQAELAQLDGQLGALGDQPDAVDHRGAIHLGAAEEHHRQAAGRDDDVGARVEQDAALALPKRFEPFESLLAGKGVDEVLHAGVDRAHADHTLLQAVADHLVLVPGDEHRIDGDQT